MGRGTFGWDLPPGCRLSDIPGNRPEDEAVEALEMGFYEQKGVFTPSQQKFIDSLTDSITMEVIFKAIEYGLELGIQQQQMLDAENKYYEHMEQNKIDEMNGNQDKHGAKLGKQEPTTCCVADQFCIAGAEMEHPHAARAECFCCGQKVCSKCSSKRKYLHYGKVRLCNDCQIEYDGNDKRVMARLNRMATYK